MSDSSSRDLWSSVDTYLDTNLVGSDPALSGALDASAAAGLPTISVSASQGKLLFLLARAIGARRILELGTLGGYSAIWMARALPPAGRLVTIEADSGHADVARANFRRAGVEDRIDLRLGKALDVLPGLASDGGDPFDFVFIDADKVNYPAYAEWAIRLSRRGALIVIDNVIRDGAVVDADSTDEAVQAVRKTIATLAADTRVTATAVQTVGAKGYDGFAIVMVL
jgi:predicted O-methyltransferase YrrM